jgi:hypothetical protein
MADPSTRDVPPAATPPAAPTPAVSPDALRIVLFGMPAAGKSSLLGAVAQAAQTQEHLLHGHLADPTHGLEELQKRLYEERSRPTAEEVAPYPITFEPFAHDGGGTKTEGLLIDCDGRVANDLLARRKGLGDDSPEGTLAREVVEADTLVLVVDAAAPTAQVEADFVEFGRFLRLLEHGRGQRSDVGGLPVFLVLTKCDLLAQPGDGLADWTDRIEERKRQVFARFQEFLGRQGGANGPVPFGKIDLHLWATAVKRPALGPTPAKPREPYGVAELFRQCLEYSRDYRRRHRQSSRRLALTAGGVVAGVAGMVALAVTFFLFGGTVRQTPLDQAILNYKSTEPITASERLRGDLDRRFAILKELQSNPQFPKVTPDLQQFVNERVQEMDAYRKFRAEVDKEVHQLAAPRNKEDLERIEKRLADLSPPDEYSREWSQTEAVQLREEKLQDVKALRPAVAEVEGWYRDRVREGKDLLQGKPSKGGDPNWPAWKDQLKRLLDTTAGLEFPPDRTLPGPTRLTYEAVYNFESVKALKAEWEDVKAKLERVRDMASSMRLLEWPDRPALLAFTSDFSAGDARARLAAFNDAYKEARQRFRLADLGDAKGPVVKALRQTAQEQYATLLEAGRQAVAKFLKEKAGPGGKETRELWAAVRPWLAGGALADWDGLALVLLRITADGEPPDPVKALSAFVEKDTFEIRIQSLVLEVPILAGVQPTGKFQVFHPATAEAGPALSLTLEESRSDDQRRVRVYRYKPEADKTLEYRPGDGLWANLPVERDRQPGWQLTWARSRSGMYQFEKLSRPPALHEENRPVMKSQVADGVTLSFVPPDGVPAVPDLVPVIDFLK